MPSPPSLPHAPDKLPGSFRVLHTADWHLGKMLGEHSREEEHRRFLAFLLDQVRAHRVDALVIAGDVFDSANPPQSAVAAYYNFLSALYRQGGCSVVIVAGNHDSPAHLEAPREILRALGAHVLGALPSSPADLLLALPSPQSARLVVAAVPFLRDRDLRIGQSGQAALEIQRELVQGITRRYQEAADAARDWTERGVPVMATGHLTVTGCATSTSEREVHVGGLGAVGCDCFPEPFGYVALGHLHHPQRAGKREHIRYAGSPLPLSFSEAGDRKEVRLLDFVQGGLGQQHALTIPAARHLVQIRCHRNTLEADLMKYDFPVGDLPSWVEVLVEDPIPGENLYEMARKCSEEGRYEVIRVAGLRGASAGGSSAGEQAAALDGMADLLANPESVFEHRLGKELALADEERAALRTIFKELCNLHQEQQRDAAANAVPAAPAGGKA